MFSPISKLVARLQAMNHGLLAAFTSAHGSARLPPRSHTQTPSKERGKKHKTL